MIVMRMNRAPKDDPRLSRGLQLLQSKISVLEDLSDRTELQVTQLTLILESKAREVQMKVELADRHVHEIRVSMDRSLEVASIFQDKIPHKEIIERQNTIKYVQAARLAHSGLSAEQIANQVDLPRGELEFIISVNRDRLMFTESELPEWVQGAKKLAGASAGAPASGAGVFSTSTEAFSLSFAEGDSNVSEPPLSNEERARRLKAEIELVENQRLVENLSRLQVEMQNLDQRLAHENNGRDLASAYDTPKVETDHLKKLGDEFRKAIREGDVSDARQPFGSHFNHQTAVFGESLGQAIPVATASKARTHADAVAQATSEAANARHVAAHQISTPNVAKDPVLARAVAQAKVQAALRSSARPSSVTKIANPEVAQARAVARDLAGNIVPAARPGEVRKVMFPRIDGSDV